METSFVVAPESMRFLFGEKRTVEYIVANPLNIEVEMKPGKVHRPQDIRERVVRCRDCAYAQNGWTSCLYWSHKESAWSRPVMPDVVPDGFCAWGEPREVGE